MAVMKDLTGKRFGKLLVLEPSPHRHGAGVFFKCLCDCGNIILKKGSVLSGGRTYSCGCYYNPKVRQDRFEAFLKTRYIGIQSISKKEGVLNPLSFEVFRELSVGLCFYCKKFPIEREIQDVGIKGEKLSVKCHGIDRISALHGYTEKNSVACCFKCNVSKMDSIISNFFLRIRNTIERLGVTRENVLDFDVDERSIDGEIVKSHKTNGKSKRFNRQKV